MHLIQLLKELSLQPQSTQELRGLILDLAIRGRLTKEWREEHPEAMELTEELFKRIRTEKAQLTKEKKISKVKSLLPVSIEEIPFTLPGNWTWQRLGEIYSYGTKQKASPDDVAIDTWVLELEDVEKVTSKLLNKVRFSERNFKSTKNIFNTGDVIYGKLRPYLDKVIIADEPGVCTTEMIPIKCHGGCVNKYLRWFLKSPLFVSYADSSTHGMNLPRMGTDKAVNALIPLPPLAEQKAIVEIVDQLLAEVDALEEQLQQRVQLKEDYVTAALRQLTIQAPAPAWAALQPHFKSAFDTPDSVEQLRQAILQLAVQGKLTAPWRQAHPDTEPASVLLEQIQAEKVRLVQEKKIKKQKTLPPIEAEEMPFDLPEGWVWCRLGEVVELISGQHIKSSDYNDNKNGVPYLTGPSDFGDKNPIFTKWTPTPKVLAHKNDILVTVKGSGVGKINLLNSDNVAIGRQLMAVRNLGLSLDFIYVFLDSDYQNMQNQKVGIAIPGISREDILHKTLPLPPLAEQKAIVALVDDLLRACDHLQAGLEVREGLLGDLMRASVREVRN